MPRIAVNGESLYYVKRGRGPAVVLLHFLGVHSYQWRYQIAALEDRYTCIALDSRGFGHSTHYSPWSVPAAAEDLAAALDALEIDRAHLVGYSMNGPVALTFNARWPQRVRSLALIDTFAKNHTHSKARIDESEQCFRYMSMREYARQYAATRLLPSTSQAAFDALVSAICLSSKDAYMEVLRGVLIPDFTALCAEVKVPTLVLCGRHDRTTPVEFSSHLTQLIAGAVERIVPTGHLGSYDDPATFSQPLFEFLDAQPR